MYPVEVAYLNEPVSDYVEATVQTIFDIHAIVSALSSAHCLSHYWLSLLLCISGTQGWYPCLLDGKGRDRQLHPGDFGSIANVCLQSPHGRIAW
jgi:hypothetical protein